MLLSDGDLRAELRDGGLAVSPIDPATQIQPASIDLRLGRAFLVFTRHFIGVIDPARRQDDLTSLVSAGADGFILHPGEFVLGCTIETVSLGRHLAGRLEGKSSLGRLGLVVHSTAGFIDPGYTGLITLELSNVATLPIRLHVGMKIGQLAVSRLTSPAERAYGSPDLGSRYQGQREPVASRAWKDFPPA